MLLRGTKIVMVLTVMLWGIVGALGNLLDWSGTLGSVQAVTTMSTFEGGGDSWRATDAALLVWLGALFIMLSKLTAAGLCGAGAWRMYGASRADAATFQAAKELALAGCGIALIMLFGGFVVIAESWFELWRSEAMRGPVLSSAFRYAGLIGLIAIVVAQPDGDVAPV